MSLIHFVRSLDSVKSAARTIEDKPLNVDFGLHDKFCDVEELKLAWRTTKIPDNVLAFFSELFNIKKTMLLKDYAMKMMRLTKQKQVRMTF